VSEERENIVNDNGDELPPEPAGELTPEARLAAAEARAAEYLDGWQRARAEFANARKRLERERGEAYLNASVDIARGLLPILDDLERALGSAPATVAADSWFEGLRLVRRKLQGILENINVKPIEAVGAPFDPNFHEALSLKPADGYESGTIIEELQTGYRLGDRVIRPSLVNVAE
jgi:molecular chaperone GrpE